MFETDAAGLRTARMWKRLGALYEKAAYESMGRGYHDTALKCARHAEVCFWQATGEGDFTQIKDLVGAAQ